jgi:hypothetical protein
VIIMTSNAGTDTVMKLCKDPETRPEADKLGEAPRADGRGPAGDGREDRDEWGWVWV